nr:hypothetical protein [Candidatus Kapabacteria bacterium]
MAKKIIEKKIRDKKLAKEPIQKKPLIPEKYQDLAFISLIVISVFVFLSGAVFGGGFISSDNLASISFRPYVDNAAESGNFPLWMPYIFGGMPSFGALLTTGERLWDFIPEIIFGLSELFRTIFGSDSARIAFFYALYGVGMYLLMRTKDQERFVAFFTAFAAVFSTSVIVWIMIGHNTKPVVFAMFPFIIMFLEKLRVKFSLLHLAGLTIALHLMMEASHVQMIFYAGCTAGLYLLFELVSRLISKKEPMKVLKTAGFLVVAAGMAFMMSSDRYLSILEYTPYSTRGSAPIMQTDSKHQDASGGNDYDYSTMWSFSPNEMMNFLVPSYHGFGKVKFTGRVTGNKETVIPTYWGQKPIEDAAPYMGIGVLGLALFGFIRNRKNIFVQFLMALSLFSLLLSFGYTFPLLYDLFYNYVPTFNKFRAPSMALAMMQFAVPIMAGFGISSIVAMKKEMSGNDNKLLYVGMAAAAGFLLIGVIYSVTGESSYMNAVDASNLTGRYPQEIKDFIWSNAVNDWMIGGFLALAVALTAFAFVKGKLKKTAMFAVFAIILVADLWRVDVRPMEYSDKPATKNDSTDNYSVN